MATTDDPRSREPGLGRKHPWPRRDGLFRFRVDQFRRLDELGFFDGRRVELIRGVIHELTIKPAHAVASELFAEALRAAFGEGWCIRHANPLDLGRHSLVEPDLAVVAGSIRDFARDHPRTAALVIEVSEASLRKDRTIKAHLYARAGIPEYWILNLVDRRLEVHRGPGPDPKRRGRFRYADVTAVPEAGNMAPLAAPRSAFAVADMLP